MAVSRWMFTKEQILHTPSRKHGIDSDKELSYRQQAANLIQDMGQRLSVTQLCINTAIVYMHRFYMFQSFGRFPRNDMAPACLFLAAKVEEQPRKLEHVIRVAHACLHRDNTPAPDPNTEAYLEQAQVIVVNENILLQTLGFETSVDHPHTHVVKTTSLVRASKDLAQTSYFLATNSLHLTTFCLQYRPSLVACVCIYLASKWSNWKIAKSNEGKEWYYYVDRTATQELLEELQAEFLSILDKGPNKLKKKIMGWKAGHREQLYQSEEEKAAALESRKLKAEPSATSSDPSRSYVSSSQHRHTNHDRKHAHIEKREHGERKEEPDRRDIPAQFHLERKEIGPTGDGHPIIKKESHPERRDIPERREERKDYNDKRNTEIKGSFDRKDSEKKDLADRKVLERKDTADRKEADGKSVVHIKREGEKKDVLERKDSDRQRAQYHERTDIHTLERKNTPDKNVISDKIDRNVYTDLMSRTSLPIQNIKTENQPETQTSAKPEFVVPKLESKPPVKEIHSASLASNDSPNVVPVSVSNPSVDSLKSAMHRSKSETTLNYKEYLQRKEREKQMLREKQQQLLEKLGKPNLNLEKQSSDKHSLNRTFTEGSQSGAHKHKPVNLDTSLPIKIQGALPRVKEETSGIEIENEVKKTTGIDIKAEQESTRKRTDTEVKIHNGKEVKPRKRSNSKSPGASKRSPRINASNNTKISPVKVEPDPNTRGQGSHLKAIKAENPHLKLQITSNSSGNTLVTPPSPALKSPVKNLKEIPKSEPFVDLGEPLRLDGNEEGVSENGPDTSKTDSFTTGSSELVRPELSNINSPSLNVTVPKITVKQEPQINETKESIAAEKLVETQNIKQEPKDSDDAGEPVIQLKPEHSGIQPLKLNIKELPDPARDIAGTKSESPIPSLKISIKKEPGSGSNTPVKYKSEHSGNNTPLKFTIKQEPSSSGSPYEPLKMKLKASGSGYHTSEKHHRRDRPEGSHEHSGKHRHKHKSHKHKDRDRERKSSKHSHGAEVPGANGKHELKIRVKLGHSGMNSSSTEPGSNTVSKHDKHKMKEGANVLPEIVLNKATNSADHERHQPWSMSELALKKSAAKELAQSPSRKRRRTPTVDEGNEIMMQQPQQKAVKTNSHRLRRSSSSHSVVSMEMSDSECGEDGVQNKGSNKDQLSSLAIKLQQAIQFQQQVIDNTLKQQQSFGYSQSGQKPVHPGYERQKSGFDLDYYCGNSTAPPLPQGHPPLPPTPPLSQADNTPPPPPPPPPQ